MKKAIWLHGCGSMLALLIGAAGTTGAVAQTAPAAQADDVVGDDIVVTARRREESLLDVPIAVSAFGGAQLERAGTVDITELANLVPSVTLEPSRATNSTLTAFIRGVGQQDPLAGFEQGVGLYLDDVYLNRPQASVLDVYDVERIEVLRGPQGTLYGRNTIGGAIKYVTRRLPDEFSASIKASYGTFDQMDGIVSVSAPLTDGIRVGASAARLTRDGFGRNLVTGRDNYDKDVFAARGTIEFETPDARLFVRLTGDYSHDMSNVRHGHREITSLLTGAPVLPNVYDTRAGANFPDQDIKAGGGSMSITAEVSDAVTLRSISAYRKDKTVSTIDFDSLQSVDVDGAAAYQNEQTSQEFQLLYNKGIVNGLVGFYYLGATARNQFDVVLATTGAVIGIPGLNSYSQGKVTTETSSFYGDFTFDFNDRLSLSVGGRYTWDERGADILRQTKTGGFSPQFGGAGVAIATATNFSGKANFKKFTPRASLSYKFAPEAMAYASYAQGFKGGGFDPRGAANIAPDTNKDGIRSYSEIYNFFLFRPETVESYEVGLKGEIADRRFTYAVAAFYMPYKNVQIPGSVAVDANGDGIAETFAGATTNAAQADIKGFEFEGTAALARDFAGAGSALNLRATLGYIDAKFKKYIGTTGADISDIRVVQNTPKWTASGTLDANVGIGSGMLSMVSTISYRSLTHQFETPSALLDQKAYALFDAGLTYSFGENRRYSIGVYGKNLTDKRYKTSGYYFINSTLAGVPILTPAGGYTATLGREGVVTNFYGNPRQVFATVSAKF